MVEINTDPPQAKGWVSSGMPGPAAAVQGPGLELWQHSHRGRGGWGTYYHLDVLLVGKYDHIIISREI